MVYHDVYYIAYLDVIDGSGMHRWVGTAVVCLDPYLPLILPGVGQLDREHTV